MKRQIKFRAWSFHNKEMYQGNSPYPAPYHFEIYENGNIGYRPTFESEDLMNFYTDTYIEGYATEPEYEKMKIAVMQWTGLKDVKGNDVFEGDVVKYQHNEQSKEYIGEVIYNESFASFWLKTGDDSGFALLGQQKIIEIIGNIYQNPELITN